MKSIGTFCFVAVEFLDGFETGEFVPLTCAITFSPWGLSAASGLALWVMPVTSAMTFACDDACCKEVWSRDTQIAR
jgi:hypothetical protein